MRIFVLGNAGRQGVVEEADILVPFLRSHAEVVLVDLRQECDLGAEKADVALVLGGDGAILRAARQMGYQQTPVLGVNLGKLGFLADLSPEQLRQCFPTVVAGHYRVTQHLMYECVIEGPDASQTFLGLNEVLIRSSPPFHQIDIDLIVDGEHVLRFGGDGFIVSTPIGSTAHSLSAGGPILGQELSAFVLTPICAHTLTNRPVVDSSEKEYTIVIRKVGTHVSLILDGQSMMPLTPEHRVRIRRAPVSFGLVKVPGHSYYQTLREKLRWGLQPNYRRES